MKTEKTMTPRASTLPSNINKFGYGISRKDLLRDEHAQYFLLYFISFVKCLNTYKYF